MLFIFEEEPTQITRGLRRSPIYCLHHSRKSLSREEVEQIMNEAKERCRDQLEQLSLAYEEAQKEPRKRGIWPKDPEYDLIIAEHIQDRACPWAMRNAMIEVLQEKGFEVLEAEDHQFFTPTVTPVPKWARAL